MDWKIIKDKQWHVLENTYSWVAEMAYVEQHAQHHAEGNVAIHTQMVLAELEKLSSYQALTEHEKEIVWVAALMHDVEKRSTSVDEGNGNISAHRHARKGEFTVRTVLYQEIPTPFVIREHIASLVRYHSIPIWLLEKFQPEKKLHELALRLDTGLLRILAEADVRGRICRDPASLLEKIELFELLCHEHQVWKKPYPFRSESARFHYFYSENDSYIDYEPFESYACEVILLSGLPGMGKDYYIQTLPKDLPIISLDAIRRKHKLNPADSSATGRVVQIAKEMAREFLRKKQGFVWNATNISYQLRSQLIDLFVTYDAKVKIVYIEKPYEIWRKQNLNREHPVPEKVLDSMLNKLEIPQLYEAHHVEYIT